MSITRRNFFRNAAAGAVAAAALPPLADLAFSELVPTSRASEPGGPIILSRNENAYGPSQIVTTSMQDSLQFANRYPDPAVKALHATNRPISFHPVGAIGSRLWLWRNPQYLRDRVSKPRQKTHNSFAHV